MANQHPAFRVCWEARCSWLADIVVPYLAEIMAPPSRPEVQKGMQICEDMHLFMYVTM